MTQWSFISRQIWIQTRLVLSSIRIWPVIKESGSGTISRMGKWLISDWLRSKILKVNNAKQNKEKWYSVQKLCLPSITKTRLFKYTENFTTKKLTFSDKNSDFFFFFFFFFHIFAQTIDCGYSNPQSMFLSRNKKNNVYPCKPQFYHIKVGSKEVNIILACFRDVKTALIKRKEFAPKVGPFWRAGN